MFSWMGGLGRQTLGGGSSPFASGPQTYGSAFRRPMGMMNRGLPTGLPPQFSGFGQRPQMPGQPQPQSPQMQGMAAPQQQSLGQSPMAYAGGPPGEGSATAGDYFARRAAAGGNPQPFTPAALPAGYAGPAAPFEPPGRMQDRSQPAWATPAPVNQIQFDANALTPEQQAAAKYAPVNMGGGMTNMGGIGSNWQPQAGFAYNGRG